DREAQRRLGRVQGEQAGRPVQGPLPPPAARARASGQQDRARDPGLHPRCGEPLNGAPAGPRFRHRLPRARDPGRRASPRRPLPGLVRSPPPATLAVRPGRLEDGPCRQDSGRRRGRDPGRRVPLRGLPAPVL
ncbi:MAG: hypothetical protein AVDCRST_MAG02-4246, partial [uncultured Rubrobacteraceae bacterium]